MSSQQWSFKKGTIKSAIYKAVSHSRACSTQYYVCTYLERTRYIAQFSTVEWRVAARLQIAWILWIRSVQSEGQKSNYVYRELSVTVARVPAAYTALGEYSKAQMHIARGEKATALNQC